MTVDGKANKRLQELNHCLQAGSKRDEDAVVGEQQHLVGDDRLNDSSIAEDVKDGCEGAVTASAVLQMPQEQPQGAMVCWERFLHLRSLKVLLVENDDSTRHVVAALLRNCGYEVTKATNGLQAWKILEDLTNHIDLVLTEVMPCLSGVALLSKIMSHKTRKNLPVIMMSSLDSMGLVFKCLSKGAVDFLVKPIRKNELKNLWQHVWRRCHSSSGSGSESCTQTQKSIKSKNVEKSGNNTGSNDEDNNGSIGLNGGDGSDDGSGTQSSWTKKAVEVDSPRHMSPSDQLAECADSTCAQVIHSNAEITGSRRVPVTAAKECQDHEERCENFAKRSRDLDVGGQRSLDLQLEYQTESPIKLVGTKKTNRLDLGSSKLSEQIDRGQLDLNSESPSSKLKYEAAKLAGAITKIIDSDKEDKEYEASNKPSKILDINSKSIKDSKELPSLELTLKRLRGGKDIGTTIQDDRNVLRRSDSSAFSRYNTASNVNKGPGGNIESTSQVVNSLEIIKKGLDCGIQSHSNGDPLNQSSNGGSNNMDMGSTTNNAFIKPAGLKNKSEVSSTINRLHSSSFQPTKNDLLCSPRQVLLDKRDDLVASLVLAQPRSTQEQLTQHYDNCHHLVHNMQQQHLPHDHDQLSLKKMAEAVPQCVSSNMLGGFVEGNAGNYSINGSASGSNHGSNGQNGSSTVNAGGMNVESDNGIAGKSGSGSGSGNRIGKNKFADREAAVTKYRQKKTERCFRKKVRYQSRKRLAEQRPRIRGQFVRQTANENTSREPECS